MEYLIMSFRTRRVLYGSPLYALLDFFLLRYLFSLFAGINDLITILIVVCLWIIHVVPMLYEEKKSTPLGRFLSTIDGVWTWFVVMLLIYLIIIFLVSIFIQIPMEILSLILLTIPIIGIYAYYNAHKLVIKEKELYFEKLGEEYTIAHLSDVHFGSVRHRKIISDITGKLNELSDTCDLTIISGDLADGSSVVEEDDLIEFKKVNMPVIFTSGNHDYYPGIKNVHAACQKAGLTILENTGMKYKNLNIYGLSYSFSDIDMPSAEEVRQFIEDDKVNIVNYHIPNGWDELSELGFDLQLSGHTHGGQFYPAIFFGNRMYEGHNMGLFKKTINGLTYYLHVTTGVGSMDIPMRWGTNSEIVVLKLKPLKTE